ncbi:MAG TPA: sulfate ABC transporter substrate-binding protein [Leptospiraceae bacterium]|nr:sulfate ABC transporter substrate-binding protein [Leptospiraceae bacterium]HMW05422.1 sulfate ABC transporter substrate-binding protein [Leptospiraceae bacterium]HMX31429.1 sulfate ABC transporter substrate-binding protein [Leptospiraceae bacterium]HMY30932.1 sulfate ABC transporter substrate-binding protein [Leptospiraceae bacterium]HMZ63343.1 sulfate ABC transporter substrate-binding protein [Leptospiraceae bacterium]
MIFILVAMTSGIISLSAKDSILNVSYDPTREFYKAYNELFAKYWKTKTGKEIDVKQSHGGSGKQARSVIDGLEADIVTLALAYDIDSIAEKSKKIPADWQKRLTNSSSPYTSTIVFLVRKGNPKAIKHWSDLIKPGVEIIAPNPKTSGGARWIYLAAWGFALKANKNDETKAKEFVTALYKNVKVLDSGARGATTTFINRKIGDVLLNWENEAYLSLREADAKDPVEIITPSVSILAEPPVSIVDANVDKHKTREVSEEYLKYLYSVEAQELAAKNFYRPSLDSVLKKYKSTFKDLKLFTINELGGWKKAQEKHFSDKGLFDQIYSLK